MDDKYPLDKLLKHPLSMVTYAAIVVVILYYIMSPYQKCTRWLNQTDPELGKAGVTQICLGRTSW